MDSITVIEPSLSVELFMTLFSVVLALYALGFICSIRGAFGAWARSLPEVRRARLAHRIDKDLKAWVEGEVDEGRKREKESEYELLKINLKLDGRWTLSSYLDQTMFEYNPGSAQEALSKRREQRLDLPILA